MQKDRISKAYEGLNNKQLATLAFHYLTNTNMAEMSRVGDAVPSRLYSRKDAEFMRFYESLFDVSALWAIEHWKAYAHMIEVQLELHLEIKAGNNPSEVKRLAEKSGRMESRLLAIDAAILRVCNENYLDIRDISKVSASTLFTPSSDDMVADADYKTEMYNNFSRLLSS